MTEPADLGPELVDRLFRHLMVDEAWSTREERGFTWWPHRAAQRVWAGRSFEDNGVSGCRLHVESDALRLDGSLEDPAASVLVALLRFPPLSSFHVDTETGAVRLWASAFVSGETAPHLLPRLAVAAALQATYVEMGAPALRQHTGLRSLTSSHPVTGPRPDADDMLNLAGARLMPAGERPSRYGDTAELAAIADDLFAREADARLVPGGLNARFPFREDGDRPFGPLSSSLLQVRTHEAHPELGNGAFLRLFLPPVIRGDLTRAALWLNQLERHDERLAGLCLGAWTLEQSEPELELPVRPAPPRLAHVTFLPNYVFAQNTLFNASMDAGMRALWAAHVFSHEHAGGP